MVNNFFARLREQLLPQQCALCGLTSGGGFPLCAICQGDLQPNASCCSRCALPLGTKESQVTTRECGRCLAKPPAFDRALAPWLYDELLAHLIHRWKFAGEHQLTALLAALWVAANPRLELVDMIVPVPLHWRRRWQRGYNQAALLGLELKKQCPALGTTKIAGNLLKRQRATALQSGLTAQARHLNLSGVFTVRQPCDNLRLAVVDDILTTGATASAAASALRSAGAEHIEIWCLARTPVENTELPEDTQY